MGRRQPELGRQPRGHRIELQAAVPGGAAAGDLLFGDGMQKRLGRCALRTKVDEAGQQDARVEKDTYGHRLRSSSMSAATSTTGRACEAAVGRATVRRPTFTRRGPGATRCKRIPESSRVMSSSEPATSPARSRIDAGITTRPALSMDVFMPLVYHFDSTREPRYRSP